MDVKTIKEALRKEGYAGWGREFGWLFEEIARLEAENKGLREGIERHKREHSFLDYSSFDDKLYALLDRKEGSHER